LIEVMPTTYFDRVCNGSGLVEGVRQNWRNKYTGESEPQAYDSAEVVLDPLVSKSGRLLWQFLAATRFVATTLDVTKIVEKSLAAAGRTGMGRVEMGRAGMGFGLDVR
jgi:hypothetical protein